jgi:hypothetical protein
MLRTVVPVVLDRQDCRGKLSFYWIRQTLVGVLFFEEEAFCLLKKKARVFLAGQIDIT